MTTQTPPPAAFQIGARVIVHGEWAGTVTQTEWRSDHYAHRVAIDGHGPAKWWNASSLAAS